MFEEQTFRLDNVFKGRKYEIRVGAHLNEGGKSIIPYEATIDNAQVVYRKARSLSTNPDVRNEIECLEALQGDPSVVKLWDYGETPDGLKFDIEDFIKPPYVSFAMPGDPLEEMGMSSVDPQDIYDLARVEYEALLRFVNKGVVITDHQDEVFVRRDASRRIDNSLFFDFGNEQWFPPSLTTAQSLSEFEGASRKLQEARVLRPDQPPPTEAIKHLRAAIANTLGLTEATTEIPAYFKKLATVSSGYLPDDTTVWEQVLSNETNRYNDFQKFWRNLVTAPTTLTHEEIKQGLITVSALFFGQQRLAKLQTDRVVGSWRLFAVRRIVPLLAALGETTWRAVSKIAAAAELKNYAAVINASNQVDDVLVLDSLKKIFVSTNPNQLSEEVQKILNLIPILHKETITIKHIPKDAAVLENKEMAFAYVDVIQAGQDMQVGNDAVAVNPQTNIVVIVDGPGAGDPHTKSEKRSEADRQATSLAEGRSNGLPIDRMNFVLMQITKPDGGGNYFLRFDTRGDCGAVVAMEKINDGYSPPRIVVYGYVPQDRVARPLIILPDRTEKTDQVVKSEISLFPGSIVIMMSDGGFEALHEERFLEQIGLTNRQARKVNISFRDIYLSTTQERQIEKQVKTFMSQGVFSVRPSRDKLLPILKTWIGDQKLEPNLTDDATIVIVELK